jgi:hypothetical protein
MRNLPKIKTSASGLKTGVATIELVMTFPALLFLGVMLFSLGNSHLQRSSAAIRARKQAWDQREPPDASPVLKISEVTQNEKSEFVERPVRLPKFVYSDYLRQAESNNALLADTWTDENPRVGFHGVSVQNKVHPRPLAQLADSAGALGGEQAVHVFEYGFDFMFGFLNGIKLGGDLGNAGMTAAAFGLIPTAIYGEFLNILSDSPFTFRFPGDAKLMIQSALND